MIHWVTNQIFNELIFIFNTTFTAGNNCMQTVSLQTELVMSLRHDSTLIHSDTSGGDKRNVLVAFEIFVWDSVNHCGTNEQSQKIHKHPNHFSVLSQEWWWTKIGVYTNIQIVCAVRQASVQALHRSYKGRPLHFQWKELQC